MSKVDLSFNGLIGVVEALAETSKLFQDHEERYEANEAAFQQIQESANQMQSLVEERLAVLNALSVELKSRQAEAIARLEEIKLHQGQAEQGPVVADARRQVEQLGQTLGVIQTLVEQLQGRQSQVEQSLLTANTMLQDHAKRLAEHEGEWETLRGLTQQAADRQEQTDKALGAIQATQQAEKNLLSHLEKSLNTVRSMAVDLEKRLAQVEISIASMKATGSDATMIGLQSVDAVRGLMQDLAERQSTMQALLDDVLQKANRIDQQVAEVQKTGTEAQALAAQALEKASQPVTAAVTVPVATVLAPEHLAEFDQFLARCEQQNKEALDKRLREATDGELQKFLEQSNTRLEQGWSNWLEPREQQIAEMEKRYESLAAKAGAAADNSSTPPGWAEAIEAACASHSSELRFVKTLLWITLAAVGLSYALVAYAVIPRG